MSVVRLGLICHVEKVPNVTTDIQRDNRDEKKAQYCCGNPVNSQMGLP